jgi:hypothetical protein
MPAADRLLPPANVIHERLTRNQRERRLLRTLLRLVRADHEARVSPTTQPPRQEAHGRDGAR